MARKIWTGEITWFDRDGSGTTETTKIAGSERGDNVVFDYAWAGVQWLAEFDKRSGRGFARRRGGAREVEAEFTGRARKPSEDAVELEGGPWFQDGQQLGWKAYLGDYEI